jgi:hypothetical protein
MYIICLGFFSPLQILVNVYNLLVLEIKKKSMHIDYVYCEILNCRQRLLTNLMAQVLFSSVFLLYLSTTLILYISLK